MNGYSPCGFRSLGSSPSSTARVKLTLYDQASGTILDDGYAQSILDANGGSVTAAGALTLKLTAADNALVGSPRVGDSEIHVARITWTWTDGGATQTGTQEIRFSVQRLQTVTTAAP